MAATLEKMRMPRTTTTPVDSWLPTGVVVVLGIRIFSNVAAIRRHLFHA